MAVILCYLSLVYIISSKPHRDELHHPTKQCNAMFVVIGIDTGDGENSRDTDAVQKMCVKSPHVL